MHERAPWPADVWSSRRHASDRRREQHERGPRRQQRHLHRLPRRVQDAAPAGAVVPIPYPNIAKSSDTAQGREEGDLRRQPVLREGLELHDEHRATRPARRRGVVSNKIKGKAEFVNYSFDVQFEGKNVPARLDLMLHNDKNTPPFPVMQGPVIAIGQPAKPLCSTCGEEYE